MEKFLSYRDEARRNIRIADHMLTMTYPMLKDPKILLAVLENIFMALTNSMASVLYYERMYKRIPPFHDTFESKFNALKSYVVKQYELDLRTVRTIAEVKELVYEHKQATVEFSRKGKFVMSRDDYALRTLSADDLKRYLKKGKEATHELLQLVSMK